LWRLCWQRSTALWCERHGHPLQYPDGGPLGAAAVVRDLLGHASVQTIEIYYMTSNVWDAGARLGAIADSASAMLT